MSRVKLNTLLSRSKKNMAKGTYKAVRNAALKVIKDAYKEGINVQISEGYRSNTRQTELYQQGRTKSGNIVTNARAGQSYHNYGVAVDYFLTTHDGSKAIWIVNNDWRRVASIAKSYGFEWGGDWTSFKDYPHLQMTDGLSLSDLQAGKRPNLKGGVKQPTKQSERKKWETDNSEWTGQLLQRGMKGEAVEDLQTMLAKNNFYPNKKEKNNGIDGYFGADTEDATRRYQKINLPNEVDGLAGVRVYNSLTGKKNKKPASKPTSWNGRTLKKGDKGEDVRELQKMLVDKHFYPNKNASNNGIDGVFGKETRNAVRRFQKVHLPYEVDGMAGKNVYRELKK